MRNTGRTAPRIQSVGTGSRGGTIGGFFGDIISELRRVHWPSRQETLRLTQLVIVVSAVVGAILASVDTGFNRLLQLFAGT